MDSVLAAAATTGKAMRCSKVAVQAAIRPASTLAQPWASPATRHNDRQATVDASSVPAAAVSETETVLRHQNSAPGGFAVLQIALETGCSATLHRRHHGVCCEGNCSQSSEV